MSQTSSSSPWWHSAVFYQIYPLSFMDSTGDGYGDLQGIISRLDYLSETLGVDAIWLSPFYKTAMQDYGYDITDHTDVDPLFGDLDTARTLIAETHKRGMRVIVDFVMNHSSDQHPWFLESRSSLTNPKRDWYVWRDSRPGGEPPTNWISVFSGPSWTFDEATDQWYRNTYLPSQPDLNWRNPEVVEAVLDVARFWLDAGVDGFRVDAAHQMMKDPLERDNPSPPAGYEPPFKTMGEYDKFLHVHDLGHPDVHAMHRNFQAVLDAYPQQPMSVGEVHIFDIPEWASYYGPDLDELSMPFNFHLMAAEWSPSGIRAVLDDLAESVPDKAWLNWTLGNHDEIRLASRVPHGHNRLAALLLLTLRGTSFLYYGDELGMRQTAVPEASKRDPWGKRVGSLSRDGERTPMQWSATTNAGFTPPTVEPWLPVASDSGTVNVETQLLDPDSILNMYRRLLALRRRSEALTVGSFAIVESGSRDVLAYSRRSNDEQFTVLLNFGSEPERVRCEQGVVEFSTMHLDRRDVSKGWIHLAGSEGVVVSH